MKLMKKEDIIRTLNIINHNKPDLSVQIVSSKVLPITDSTTPSSSSSSSSSSLVLSSNVDDHHNCESLDQKMPEKVKGNSNYNKAKALFKLKELMRWAAAVKADKGGKLGRKVMHFRNKSATIKGVGYEETKSNSESPKISFRWEVESCSTTCSIASAPPSFKYDKCSSKRGSWITTDDDFVVLEL